MSNPTPRKGCRIICDTDKTAPSEDGSISSASLRCSRPLCSSQNTGGTPRAQPESQPHQGPKTVPPELVTKHRAAVVQRSVGTEVPAGPSGPNSVQKTSTLIRTVPTCRSRCTEFRTRDPGHNVNVPPMSATGEQMPPKWLRALLAPVSPV